MSVQTIERVITPAPTTSIRPGDIPREPFKITETALSPTTRVYGRTVEQPKRDFAKYEGPEYEDIKKEPVKEQFGLRKVLTTTPESRREFVRSRKEYNVQATEFNKQAKESIEAQKKEIERYNKAIKEWNEKGRFQTQTITETFTPQTVRYEFPEITYQVRQTQPTQTQKLSADEITSKLFKPSAPELVGPVKPPVQQKGLIVGQFEAYDPLEGVKSPLKRASFKYQSTIERLSDLKYIDTGKPVKDIFTGAGASLAIIPVSGLKRATDIISFIGDITPTTNLRTGEIKRYKDRERLPQQYKLGELTGLSTQTRGEQVYSSIITRPEQLVGEVATDLFLFSGISRTASALKSTQVRLTSKYIAPEKIFDVGVLQGKTTFPLQKSPKLSSKIAEFKKYSEVIDGKIKYPTLHATDFPSRISVVKPPMELSKRTGLLKEDPILYVAPYGRGSPYFLRIPDSTTLPKFTFDITKWFNQSSPKLYRPYVSDIKGLPKSVMKAKGYEPVLEFGKTARKDVAYITKRSALRTREIEAGLQMDTVLNPLSRKALFSPYKGQSYYTIYQGKTIPILDVQATNKVFTNSIDDVINFSKGFSSKSGKITQSQINKFYQSYYLQASQPRLYVSPSAVSPSSIFRNLTGISSVTSVTGKSTPFIFSPIKPTVSEVSTISNYMDGSISATNKIVTSSINSTYDYDQSITSSVTKGPVSYTLPTMSDYYPPVPPTLKTPPFIPYPPPPPTKRKKSDSDYKEPREINLEDAWIPEYKSKGKWKPIKIDNRKRNYYSAKELGAYVVDHASERSFRLRRLRGQKAEIIKTSPPVNIYKFYKPSKTRNPNLTGAWIEDSKYAIDTAGERQGITAKGLIAIERKRQQQSLGLVPKVKKTKQKRKRSYYNKLIGL